MDDVRAANREIGRRYDETPYDPAIGSRLDPDLLFARAVAYGCAWPGGDGPDVLDLGCGTGGQLWRAGQYTGGRLVGVDISAAACATARERLAGYGDRARIVCTDLLDAGGLGAFQLIYLIGTYYIAAPAVRASLASLIGASLAPGGVVAVSYYTGAAGQARAAAVAAARASGAPADPVMAFEMLGPWFDAFADDELAAALGLRFLQHVEPAPPDGGYVVGLFSAAAA